MFRARLVPSLSRWVRQLECLSSSRLDLIFSRSLDVELFHLYCTEKPHISCHPKFIVYHVVICRVVFNVSRIISLLSYHSQKHPSENAIWLDGRRQWSNSLKIYWSTCENSSTIAQLSHHLRLHLRRANTTNTCLIWELIDCKTE